MLLLRSRLCWGGKQEVAILPSLLLLCALVCSIAVALHGSPDLPPRSSLRLLHGASPAQPLLSREQQPAHRRASARRPAEDSDEEAAEKEEEGGEGGGGGGAAAPKAPYSLGAKVSNWDEQRAAWLAQNPKSPSHINGRPRIMLLSGSQPAPCHSPEGDHYLVKSIKNKMDYCRLHGVEIFYNMAQLDSEMTGFWTKLPLLRRVMLSHPDIEWIWWMDSDAMVTDMVFQLPMERYKDHNAVFPGWDHMVYLKKSWVGLNTGSFLIRNCQWSLDLLDAWAPMGPKGVRKQAGHILTQALDGRPSFEADDQSAMIYLLATQKDLWREKVYLEGQYYLHAYWVIVVERFEEMKEKYHPGLGDSRWPFVTHFVGCKPCGKSFDYTVQRCMDQMERAFNFADDQILQMYGFQHKGLGSWEVKRIFNETDRPLEFQDGLKLLRRSSSSSSSIIINKNIDGYHPHMPSDVSL